MKAGTDLTTLAKEVERRIDTKKDYIAPVNKLAMHVAKEHPLVRIGAQDFPLTDLAHEQVADYLEIPTRYYKRMLIDAPELLAANVNEWLPQKVGSAKGPVAGGNNVRPDQRMVRTLDGKVRAFLSSGYRKLENEDLLEAVLPVLEEHKLFLLSAELTETRLYLKAVDRSVSREIALHGSHHFVRSDIIHPIVVISNSEVGKGSLSVEGGTFTEWCTNLAVFNARMRKYHTGARAEVSDEAYALLSTDTKRLTDAAIWSQARDLVVASLSEVEFQKNVDKLQDAVEQKIEDDPIKVVERVAKRYSFTEASKTGVLQRLVEGGDLTRYGLHAAVTRHSADESDYDEATRMERVGGEIIELPRSDWKEIAEGFATRTRQKAAA